MNGVENSDMRRQSAIRTHSRLLYEEKKNDKKAVEKDVLSIFTINGFEICADVSSGNFQKSFWKGPV
jgi:hypothetical protein